jgi:hypothetical protein
MTVKCGALDEDEEEVKLAMLQQRAEGLIWG